MGFSVSGAAAVVFAGMFIAFGMFYTASANSFEQVSDAQQEKTERTLTTKNVEITITTASYDSVNDELSVDVENVGTRTLSLNDTDIFIDNRYQTDWRDGATVAGNGDTYLWQPGETLSVTFAEGSQPSRVKVVTEQGVADTAGVS